MTPVTEIIGKIVSDYQNGIYPDRDEKRFAFYERCEMEAEEFEKSMLDQYPFSFLERYSDEPIVYENDATHREWVKWLAKKGLSLEDEFR